MAIQDVPVAVGSRGDPHAVGVKKIAASDYLLPDRNHSLRDRADQIVVLVFVAPLEDSRTQGRRFIFQKKQQSEAVKLLKDYDVVVRRQSRAAHIG